VYHALDNGGVFVFDIVERSPDDPMRYEVIRSGVDWCVEVEVAEFPKRRLLTRNIAVTRRIDGTTRRSREVHHVRTFDRAQVEKLLVNCGFTVRVTQSYGALDLPPKRLGFMARKQHT
jgi:hypothetical protein